MDTFRLLWCGALLSLFATGCGKYGADQVVLEHEVEQNQVAALAQEGSADFGSLASANIDAGFASAGCSARSDGSRCGDVTQGSVAIAEPVTRANTELADQPGLPETSENILLDPVSPQDEAIVRDALYTLGEERCTPNSDSAIECPVSSEPVDQLKF